MNSIRGGKLGLLSIALFRIMMFVILLLLGLSILRGDSRDIGVQGAWIYIWAGAVPSLFVAASCLLLRQQVVRVALVHDCILLIGFAWLVVLSLSDSGVVYALAALLPLWVFILEGMILMVVYFGRRGSLG